MEQLYLLFSGVRWQDILDILLNSYILFRLYVLLQGTSVIRILFPIAFLWIAQQVGHSLGLIISSWAMQGLIAVVTLVVIVVFRYEISGVLRTKDLKSFFWGFPKFQVHTPAGIIARSAFELAKRRMGALVVLPARQSIHHAVQGGVEWQGKLSVEMLVSIFWHNNPVHDGAAIIEEGRVTRVGVILPLATQNDLPSKYGTRHRAAIGLSEQTDAVIIVVSEERSDVTLIKNQQITSVKNQQHLSELLETTFKEPVSASILRSPKGRLTLAAVTCFLCVVGVWFNLTRGMETLAGYEVPVEFANLEHGMDVLTTSVSSAKLFVSGSPPLLKSLASGQMKIKADLSGLPAGINRIDIDQDTVSLPPGIRFKRIEPSVIEINIDKLIEKEVLVQADFTGRLSPGLIMKEVAVMPDKIRITGPGKILDNIQTVFTTPIPLGSIKTSGIQTIELEIDPKFVRMERGDHFNVRLRYVIEKRSS